MENDPKKGEYKTQNSGLDSNSNMNLQFDATESEPQTPIVNDVVKQMKNNKSRFEFGKILGDNLKALKKTKMNERIYQLQDLKYSKNEVNDINCHSVFQYDNCAYFMDIKCEVSKLELEPYSYDGKQTKKKFELIKNGDMYNGEKLSILLDNIRSKPYLYC